MPIVSFVIPIYKAEQFLHCCLESIQNQSITDIEIICINDNSPDQSKRIIKSFINKDSRIKLINLEENRGAGYARNHGIKLAEGRYIRMVDPDDFIPLDSTEKLLDPVFQYKSDFVRGGFRRCTIDGKKLHKGPRFPKQKLVNGSFQRNRELWYFDQHCTYLYSTDVIKKSGAEYAEGMSNGEDVAFFIQLATYMDKVTLIPETVYYYRYNQSSTMLSHKNKQYYLNLFKLYEMEYSQLASIGFREQVDNFIFYHLACILPGIVFPSIPDNLQRQEAVDVLANLKKVIDKYDIDKLCFSSQYIWQKECKIPLLSRQVVALLSAGYISEAYESINENVFNDNKIGCQQKRISSLINSTSWRLTAPLRWLKKRKLK